jgi:hypothetical protein
MMKMFGCFMVWMVKGGGELMGSEGRSAFWKALRE